MSKHREDRLPRFRAVLINNKFALQRWFDRFLFWPAGWYTQYSNLEGSGWTRNPHHGEMFNTYGDVERDVQRYQVDRYLPYPDVEPGKVYPELRVQLIAAVEASEVADYGPRLIYADWLDENGLHNNANRIRLEAAIIFKMRQETERV